jgi:hypothetical protein
MAELLSTLDGKIHVEQRHGDWIAFVAGDRSRWEVGKTYQDAIDRLRISFPDLRLDRAPRPRRRLSDMPEPPLTPPSPW